jgi:hypothetical protein
VAIILDRALLFVTERIDLVKCQTCFKCPYAGNPEEELYWTGTIVELVEMIYPLHELKRFNNGRITLKKLFHILGKALHIEIKDCARTFTDIKNRRMDEDTKFLDLLTQTEKRLIEEANLRPPRK